MADDKNDSDTVQAHNDFDLQDVFKILPLDPLTMDELLDQAKKFGDAHRNLINKFLAEPTMTAKKMNLLFARHVTTVKYKKHPEAVMRIQATPETSHELTKRIIKTINKEAGENEFRPWCLAMSTDEKSPTEFVTMTGNTQNSTIISDASDFTKAERALLLTILEQMITGDGTVKMRAVHDYVKTDPCKMTGQKCDQFMAKMMRQRYLAMDDDGEVVEITPRLIVELEPWLRAKFVGELKICDSCRKIIGRPVYMAECKKCHATQHFNCFKKSLSIADKDSMECQKCKQELTMSEVQEQIEERQAIGLNSRKRRRAPSADSDEDRAEPEPEDMDED